MRKVSKKFGTIPAKLKSIECEKLIKDSLITKGKHKFDTNIYGHSSVRTALDKIYLSKCAFCETDPSAGVTMQVEHYRPKAKITEDKTHGGYYWLAYQWSNLLLACPACNNKKRNRFPITATREKLPLLSDGNLDLSKCSSNGLNLLNEQPLLVNPETDPNPMQHFRFQATGEIEHKTNAGKTTIEVCGLNRGSLIKKRKKLYDTTLNKLLKAIDKHDSGLITDIQFKDRIENAIIDLIDYINTTENEYIEFAKTCWKEFEGFYLARFQPSQRQKLQPIYQNIKSIYDNI